MLIADGIWPPLNSYGKRQSNTTTSSNIVLNGGRLPGGGLGVEQADEEADGGEEVSVSDAMLCLSSSASCCLRRFHSSLPRNSSATVAQLTIATPSAVLPLSGSLPLPCQRQEGEAGGEGVGEGELDGCGDGASGGGDGGGTSKFGCGSSMGEAEMDGGKNGAPGDEL